MRRAFPWSLGFFLAAGLVMLLQLIPVVGVFLMFMAAALWSVALINVGMVGVTYESLSGRVARRWLLVPLAFYGGYYAFALSDYIALTRFRSEIAVANAAVHIPFDPRQGVLVAASRDRDGKIGGA